MKDIVVTNSRKNKLKTMNLAPSHVRARTSTYNTGGGGGGGGGGDGGGFRNGHPFLATAPIGADVPRKTQRVHRAHKNYSRTCFCVSMILFGVLILIALALSIAAIILVTTHTHHNAKPRSQKGKERRGGGGDGEWHRMFRQSSSSNPPSCASTCVINTGVCDDEDVCVCLDGFLFDDSGNSCTAIIV